MFDSQHVLWDQINMERVADIIDGLGGNAAVSRELRIKPSAVSEMKRRNSIPPKYWLGLIRLSQSRGGGALTADRLVVIHAQFVADDCHISSAPMLEQENGAHGGVRHVTVSDRDLPAAGCR
ncbi:carph-isopro domain-containing protein [Aureimonas sp. D3]|uniref:carph-isopro domain-containing protein n=1 Tax=Aureimonas sp. D3 TaxID=1638164 RepID=UPI0035B534BE